MRKALQDLVQIHLVFGQCVSEILGQRCDLKGIEVVWVCASNTGWGKVVDRVERVGAPLAAAAATLPLFPKACAAVVPDSCRRGGRLQKPQRRGLGEVFDQRINSGNARWRAARSWLRSCLPRFLRAMCRCITRYAALSSGARATGRKHLPCRSKAKTL